jgi:hypothetical protein
MRNLPAWVTRTNGLNVAGSRNALISARVSALDFVLTYEDIASQKTFAGQVGGESVINDGVSVMEKGGALIVAAVIELAAVRACRD